MSRGLLTLLAFALVVVAAMYAVRVWPPATGISHDANRRSAQLAAYFESLLLDGGVMSSEEDERPRSRGEDATKVRVIKTPPPSMQEVVAAIGMPEVESRRYGRFGLVSYYRWLVPAPDGEVRLIRPDDRTAPGLAIAEAGPSRRRGRFLCGYRTVLEADVDSEDLILTLTLSPDARRREVVGRDAEDWRSLDLRVVSERMPAGLDAGSSPCASGVR